ncbi:MAG: hypothetical protein MI974_06370 [Chitinophagales bacterium]|nr:hypothetical protein [Chitinophagales bacterium]
MNEFNMENIIYQIEYNIKNYTSSIEKLMEQFEEYRAAAGVLTKQYEDKLKMINLHVENAWKRIERQTVLEKETEVKNAILAGSEVDYYESILTKTNLLTEERQQGIINLRKSVEIARDVNIEEIGKLEKVNKEQLEKVPQLQTEELSETYNNEKRKILFAFEEKIAQFIYDWKLIFNKHYETALELENIDPAILPVKKQPLPYINLGASEYQLELFGMTTPLILYHFVPFFHQKNILFRYRGKITEKPSEIVGSILARALMSCKPGKIKLHLVDPMNKGRNFRKFSKLSSDLKTIYTKTKEIDRLFKSLDKNITRRFQNYLRDEYDDLSNFNQSEEEEVPYQLVILMNYPEKLSEKSLKRLKIILENGPIAGINLIVVKEKEMLKNEVPVYPIDFESFCSVIDIDAPPSLDVVNNIEVAPFIEEGQFSGVDQIIDHVNGLVYSDELDIRTSPIDEDLDNDVVEY